MKEALAEKRREELAEKMRNRRLACVSVVTLSFIGTIALLGVKGIASQVLFVFGVSQPSMQFRSDYDWFFEWMVEVRKLRPEAGLEPTTLGLVLRRSSNWATQVIPFDVHLAW